MPTTKNTKNQPAKENAPEAPVKEKAPEAPVKETAAKAPAKEKAAKAPAKEKAAKAPAKKETAKAPAKETTAKAPVEETVAEAPATEEAAKAPVEETVAEAPVNTVPEPRRSVAFIGSECYPFVKTGGLGDVMYALPRALTKLNCDVKVILPRYRCIPEEYQQKMVYKGDFMMDLCSDGRRFYVGIMELEMDGVVYDFIDNDEFFSWGNP